MEKTELRIGNYIMNPQVVVTVTGIDEQYVKHTEIDGSTKCLLEQADSILLTEEWLLKFGFKKIPMENTGPYSQDKDKYCKSFVEITQGNTGMWNYQNNTDFFWVHNLQNLYFALTGEELTI